MKLAYYNEFDPYAAAWLRNLIAAGHIPAGEVDERDIREVSGDDLKGFGQVHLFAGLGGWAAAARLAGVPDDRPLWTASCPCPPFSVAGKQKTCPSCGSALLVPCPRRTGYFICADCDHAWDEDPRHVWPEAWRLVAERRPAIVFGEQVESIDGRRWFAGVRGSLEILGSAVAASDLCAASVGAPHPRQRLWWVAHADGGHPGTERLQRGGKQRQQPPDGGAGRGLANATEGRWGPRRSGRTSNRQHPCTAIGGLREAGGMVHPPREQVGRAGQPRQDGFWDAFDIVSCGDGKSRRVEPGTFPLAHGIPARMGQLRAYGNAIVRQVGARFIREAYAAL